MPSVVALRRDPRKNDRQISANVRRETRGAVWYQRLGDLFPGNREGVDPNPDTA